MSHFPKTLGKFWSRSAAFHHPRFSSVTQQRADSSTCGCKSFSLAPRYERRQNKYCIGKVQEPTSLTNDVTKKKWRRGISRDYDWCENVSKVHRGNSMTESLQVTHKVTLKTKSHVWTTAPFAYYQLTLKCYKLAINGSLLTILNYKRR